MIFFVKLFFGRFRERLFVFLGEKIKLSPDWKGGGAVRASEWSDSGTLESG